MNATKALRPRKAYMDREITHREYYGQLVNPKVASIVSQAFGTALETSTAEHFNDIPLQRWDNLFTSIKAAVPELPGGEIWSLSTGVCIAKEAARQHVERINQAKEGN